MNIDMKTHFPWKVLMMRCNSSNKVGRLGRVDPLAISIWESEWTLHTFGRGLAAAAMQDALQGTPKIHLNVTKHLPSK